MSFSCSFISFNSAVMALLTADCCSVNTSNGEEVEVDDRFCKVFVTLGGYC